MVPDERPGDGDPLLLPAGEPRAGRGRGGALQQVNLVDFIMMTFI